jgi:hypothetical protein
VTSYTGVVPRYVGSFEYDHAPQCCRGRRQVVTALSIRYSGIVVVVHPLTFEYGVGLLKDVTGLVVYQCGTFSLISRVLALSPNLVPCVTLAFMNRCFRTLFVCLCSH